MHLADLGADLGTKIQDLHIAENLQNVGGIVGENLQNVGGQFFLQYFDTLMDDISTSIFECLLMPGGYERFQFTRN